MRTGFTGFLLAGLAAAALGASAIDSYGQSTPRKPVTHARHSAADADASPQHRQAAKKTATKPPKATTQASEADKLARPEFTAADEAAAQIPGMPGVRFWADSTADFERALGSPVR